MVISPAWLLVAGLLVTCSKSISASSKDAEDAAFAYRQQRELETYDSDIEVRRLPDFHAHALLAEDTLTSVSHLHVSRFRWAKEEERGL